MISQLPNGLVLIGGHSRRMGVDKALLRVNGQTFLQQTVTRLASVCHEVFISGREAQFRSQKIQTALANYPILVDKYADIGPFSGLLTALEAFPETPWLILPCDMPAFPEMLLQQLIQLRNPANYATVIETQGILQPFGALYEPSCLPLMREALTTRQTSLRRFLEMLKTKELLTILDGNALISHCDRAFLNINTPEAFQQYLAQ